MKMNKHYDNVPYLVLERNGFPTSYNLLRDDQKELIDYIGDAVEKSYEEEVEELRSELELTMAALKMLKEDISFRLDSIIQGEHDQ